MDRATTITLIKNHLNANETNAILIDNNFYEIFKKTRDELFPNNGKFEILNA